MHLAIVTEEYLNYADLGGFLEVCKMLRELYPEARWFRVRARKVPQTFWKSWRMAIEVENIDLRGFDGVISLGHGFAHGVITQSRTIHLSYLFSVPSLWMQPGRRGRWYRLWSFARSAQVERWIAGSPDAAEHLAVSWRIKKNIFCPDSVIDFKRYIQGILENNL